jgi:hypothetical protein
MEQGLQSTELEYTILNFYENYVVSRVKEGALISSKEIKDLVEICSGFYKNKEFVYISKRVTNYNVDPTIYLNLEKVENLAGIAIVSSKVSSINMASFEQNFSKVPFDIFLDLEDALEWKNEVIKNKKAGL